ncbi:MAG: PD40 domain-containing protein, partial [Holophagales bacterium]|nr:PD40 domain-containing protein [Holophagales bacterium]
GAPLRVADAPNGRGGAWLPNGDIVFAPDFRTGLVRVRASGGATAPLTTVDATRHSSHRWPVATPDGRALVYLATNHESAKQKESELRWVRADGGDDHALVASLANGAVADGRLFYLREKTLFSQPIDLGTGTLSGEPTRVAQDTLFDPSTWRATFAVAAGRLLYSPAGAAAGSHLSRVDRSGRLLEELAPDGVYNEVVLSPDGRWLAVGRGLPADIWLLDLERRTFARFSFEAGDELGPVWSRDGRWLYYTSFDSSGSGSRVYRKAAHGGGGSELVLESASVAESVFPTDLSVDGKRLLAAIGRFPLVDVSDMIWVELGPPNRVQPWIQGPALEGDAHFSPDDRWVVYDSTESGVSQVYVRAAPGHAGQETARWQLSVDGGVRPIWSRDGSEIVYLEPSLNLSRVAVADDSAGGLRFGSPEPLFGTTLLADTQSFDLAPDGQSLILNHFGEAQSRPLRLVLSWQPPA